MRFFIDTGSVAEVEEIAAWGILSGATTNPSLLAKEQGDPGDIVRRICDLVRGPVSAEVVSQDPQGMIAEGRALRELHEHVTVKVPFCEEGLAATHALAADGIPVNMTLVFSANQALLAAGAGATYVSCFMGRLDDISVDSGQVLAEIVECFRAGGVTAQIIAASIRHPEHVISAAQLGCEIAPVADSDLARQHLADLHALAAELEVPSYRLLHREELIAEIEARRGGPGFA